jgi:predicted protein tyrosine phosphatase
MEKKHIRRLRDKFEVMLSDKIVWNLDIPDDYGFIILPTEYPFLKECEGQSPMCREGMNVGW